MTLVQLVRAALAGADRPLFHERDKGGNWSAAGSLDVLARVTALAATLRDRGLAAGDRVALMSSNRVDWIVANLAILFAGGVAVPIYATQALDQVAFIVADSGARFSFVDTPELAERLRAAAIPLDPIVFDAPPEQRDSLAAAIAHGRGLPAELPEVAADDLAVLIYTSGTTGTPKGVMLSHGNVASNAYAAFGLVAAIITPGDPVLSVLPFAHIYENTNLFGYLLRGAAVYVNRRIESFLDDMRTVRPVAVFVVPRIFERTYAGIVAAARAAGGLKAKLVPWALTIGRRYKRAELDGAARGPLLRAEFALARALVLSKLRAQLGCDRLRIFVSGSASLHLDLALTFAAAGMPIIEGYGLTECSPVVTVNRPSAPHFGTVGSPISGVEVRLADDGEVFVRGPNVMQGYYHQPEETAGVLQDGWLATGDVGTLDAGGNLRIIDRKGEIFKTSGGKYISPARVEAALGRSPFIAQVAVLGNGQAHAAALVSPNWVALRSRMGLAAGLSPADLYGRDDVRRFIAEECARNSAELAPFEQIRWTAVLPRDLTIEDGELTPTLKVRRRIVEARYAGLVAEFEEGITP